VSPEPHDELWEAVARRLVEEGLPRERAEVLASGLVDSDTRIGPLTEMLERLEKQAEEPSESIDGATGGDGHESQLRHPVRRVAHEVEHFREVADEGKSAATPAILSGGVIIILALVTAVLIGAGFLAYYMVSGGGSSSSSSAPAFKASDLAALPTDNWITNGGSVMNQRYSPLTQVTTANVARLKGVWLTHLRKSGVAAKYSAEGQPLEYKGVIYVPTGADDVFAVDVASGKILWQHEAHLYQGISTLCCGWISRGVALGDGKLYIGQLDGNLVALDQKTGNVVWSTQVARWQDGYTITSAPLYYNGRVYTGLSGGEYQVRGRVTAFNAKTGKELWRFYTIPGPGKIGHDTWPQTGSAWKNGGAPVWQTPAVDPKLGLLYFSTGNASPDDDGHIRPGDNLFATSIVAIDAATGKYRWHFQEVHHDIWDYDAPSPVVLFDVKVNGTLRHAIAQSGKTGWTYILDRTNGKPLYSITEKPVPQNAQQATAKTQPFPSNPSVIPQKVTEANFEAIAKAAAQNSETKGLTPVKASRIFTPVRKGTVTVVLPNPMGGTNWPPMSYNPNTQMLYVCSVAATGGLSYGATKPPAKPGSTEYVGSVWTFGGTRPGFFTAIDVRSGRIVWQKRWSELCYSGSATTAGNLVFVGRNSGDLQALDARTGKELWSFQTGAGANNTATVFQHDGTEYVAFFAGGNALAGDAHGDNLWLFSLDGKLGSVQAAERDHAIHHAGEALSGSAEGGSAAGKTIFAANCATCHGTLGRGGNGGPDLSSIPAAKDLMRVIAQVRNGGGGMPPFKTTLTEKQISVVAAYVTSKIAK